METLDRRVIKSFVWHGDKCFFVSTIERDSSAPILPTPRYNETLIWEYDWEKKERLLLIYQGDDMRGSISKHLCWCSAIHRDGCIEDL